MTLIDMNMPQSCQECPAFATKACDKWDKHKTFSDQRTKRHNDCPLKSIDGLIEKIQESKIDVDLDFGQEMYYNNAVDDIIEIIKEYCGGELE